MGRRPHKGEHSPGRECTTKSVGPIPTITSARTPREAELNGSAPIGRDQRPTRKMTPPAEHPGGPPTMPLINNDRLGRSVVGCGGMLAIIGVTLAAVAALLLIVMLILSR
jgi:hypothetical protein